MWSAFSKDFMNFAKNVKEESHGFMGALTRFAAEVVGEDGVYAGDEASQEAADMPLDVQTLLKFQEDRRTYTEPLSALEHTVFGDWSSTSPFSSLQAAMRRAKRAANKAGNPPTPGTKADATDAWADEPDDETRQRLLDYSEAVLEKYMELVGEAVSPRTSVPRRGNGAASPKTQVSPAPADVAATPKNAGSQHSDPTPADTTPAATADGASPAPATPTPVRAPGSPAAGHTLSEDDFFDRYFFRLAQLRCQVAEQRREHMEVEEAARKRAQQAHESAEKRTSRAVDAAGATPAGEEDEDQGRDEDDVAVPLFARKVISAASGFMNAVDTALIGSKDGRDPDGSDDDNVPPEMIEAEAGGAVGPRSLMPSEARKPVSPGALQQQVVGLETVVHELQEALRGASARTQQLESLLRSHNIPLPPPPTLTPQKPHSPLKVVSSVATPATESSDTHAVPATTHTAVSLASPATTPNAAATTTASAPAPATPTPIAAPPAVPSSTAATPYAASSATPGALPPSPPAFKPFVATTPLGQAPLSTAATTTADTTPTAVPPSPPTGLGVTGARTSQGTTPFRPSPHASTTPLSSKKNE